MVHKRVLVHRRVFGPQKSFWVFVRRRPDNATPDHRDIVHTNNANHDAAAISRFFAFVYPSDENFVCPFHDLKNWEGIFVRRQK